MEPTSVPTPTPFPGVFSLLKQALSFYGKHYKVLIPVGLVVVAYNIIVRVITLLIDVDKSMAAMIGLVIFSIIAGIVGAALQMFMQISFVRVVKELDFGISSKVGELYKSSAKFFWPFVWISILTCVVTMGLMPFFFIPAIIVGVFIFFAQYAVILDDKRGLKALATSFHYVNGNWWKVFGRQIAVALILLVIVVIILVIVISAIFSSGFVIPSSSAELEALKNAADVFFDKSIWGLLISLVMSFVWICVVFPILTFYHYAIYKHLKSIKGEPTEENLQNPRGWFLGLSIWGLVLGVLFMALALLVPAAMVAVKSLDALKNTQTSPNKSTPLFPAVALPLSATKPTLLESKPYVSKEFGFSINAPKNWGVASDADAVLINPTAASGIDTGIVIETKDVPTANRHGATDEELMESVGETVLDEAEIPKTVTFKKYNLSNLPVYLIEGEATLSGGIGKVQLYYILVNEKVYVITVRSSAKDWEQVAPLILESVATFKAI